MPELLMGEKMVLPGLVDIHVHLREPGTNQSETIGSGTYAALLGGYALVGDMPNNPGRPTWTEERMVEKGDIGRESSYTSVTFHAGSQPESDNIGELAGMARMSLELKFYGGETTGNKRDYEANEFREIVREWHRVAPDKVIGLHAGEYNLEDFITLIAREFEHPLHIHHVHSSSQIEIIAGAKKEGLPITSGICPHHLLKTNFDTKTEGWFGRMMPPLTSADEAEKLMHYLANGSIDIVETDHAPHMLETKLKVEENNPDHEHGEGKQTCFGVPSIDHAASVMFYQVKRGAISMERLIDAMSTKPAAILGVKLGKNTQTTWDMQEYRIGDQDVKSGALWTPFAGKLAVGRVVRSSIGNTVCYSDGNIVRRHRRVITKRSTTI